MDLLQFATDIVKAADAGAPIHILPIGVQDFTKNCILRFRLGTIY